MSNITVVTSLTASKDLLREDQVKGNAKWVAYLDGETLPISNVWEIKKAHDRFLSPRRNSRIHKLLIHQYVDTEYSIWMDANIALKVTPEELIKEYMQGYDFAVFKHPERDCIYDEAMIAAVHKLDDPEVIIEQVKGYEEKGFAKKKGMAECNVIIRRHTPKIETFNNAWWSEYCRHSVRDQISFMYAVDKVGLRINYIVPCARNGHPWFSFNSHLTPRNENPS